VTEAGAELKAQLDRAADRIAAAVPVARAIVNGRKAMSILDKLDLIKTRREEHNVALDTGADAVLAGYERVAIKRDQAFEKHLSAIKGEETALQATEAAIDRMSNMGNSQGSETSSGQQSGSGE
jgi:hypothetical protein